MVAFSDLYVLLAVTGSFIFGYQLAVLNASMTLFTAYFKVCGNNFETSCPDAVQLEATTRTMVFAGAAVGCILGSHLVAIGRRISLIICHFLSIGSALLCAIAASQRWFIVGRLLAGLAVGFFTVVVPTFINEISRVETRGKRGVFHQTGITVGILVALASGYILPAPLTNSGETMNMAVPRIIQALPGVISAVAIIAMFTYLRHDTPLSLLKRGKSKAANVVLELIYEDEPSVAEERFYDLTDSLMQDTSTGSKTSIFEILRNQSYFRLTMLACFLASAQQLSGINVFVGMSNQIFTKLGMSESYALHASVAMGFVNFLMTFPTILLIERAGRKALLFSGALGQAIFLSIVPICALLNFDLTLISAVAVIGFIVCFAYGMGATLWVYLFEMFPVEIKDTSAGLASAICWISGGLVVYLNSLFSNESYTIAKFIIFAAVSAITALVVLLIAKDTKAIKPSTVESHNLSESRPLKSEA